MFYVWIQLGSVEICTRSAPRCIPDLHMRLSESMGACKYSHPTNHLQHLGPKFLMFRIRSVHVMEMCPCTLISFVTDPAQSALLEQTNHFGIFAQDRVVIIPAYRSDTFPITLSILPCQELPQPTWRRKNTPNARRRAVTFSSSRIIPYALWRSTRT